MKTTYRTVRGPKKYPIFKIRLKARQLGQKFAKDWPLRDEVGRLRLQVETLTDEKIKLLKVLSSYDGDHGAEHWEDAIASGAWNESRIKVLEEFGFGPT